MSAGANDVGQAGHSTGTREESSTFKHLCGNVTTAMITLDNSLQEFLQLKDELLKHPLPSNLLVTLTVMSSRLFRCYSDLCTPVGELNRLSLAHSSSWEMKAESLKKIRSDYESMQRRLNIALKKLEMMAVEASRMKHEKVLGDWEKLFCHVMLTESHGRRWKFRIEPLRRKVEAGYNPYLSDSDSDSDMSNQDEEEMLFEIDDQLENVASHGKNNVMSSTENESRRTTPTPPPPPIVMTDGSTSTSDLEYDSYLLVQLSRPSGVLPKKDICCTISLGDNFYTSEVFPGKPEQGTFPAAQVFHFPLSEEEAAGLPLTNSMTKLVVGIYPRNIGEELAANVALPLADIKMTEESTVIVPPRVRGDEEFELDWEKINSEVSGLPVQYPLTLRGQVEAKDEIDDDQDVPLLPLICHRVKVQRHQYMESTTVTLPWEDLMSEMGYREVPDTQSRAASALPYDPAPSPPTPEEVGPTEEEVREELERETQGKLRTLSLQHMEEMQELQHQYEEKLNSLSKTLAKVKAEKSRQIEDLEQTLVEMEKSKATGRKGRSMADIQRAIARRRKRVSHGLPEWGKDLPDDFFERLELFREESIRKQEELIDRIRGEVSEACEKQLATQHKLAQGARHEVDTLTEDVTLPALFMPTPLNKHLVYTPRAHQYFHPPGSTDSRVTQPPAVFKLPALQSGLQTLNLFELSQHFSQTGPQWLKESGSSQSPHVTPAPPPSACGFYHTITMPRKQADSAEGELEESEMDYGGDISGRAGHRAQYAPSRTK